MHNVSFNNDDGKLTITVDLRHATSAPLSSTGKTKLVASTSGAVAVGSSADGLPVSFSLNVMAKNN